MAERHYVRCIVRGNTLAESSEKKTPSVKIRLQAVKGANPLLDGHAEDRTLWADLWLTDAAFARSIETLETVFGWTGASLAELNDPILEGIEVDAACEWESFEGQNGIEWREKAAFLNAPGGGGGLKKMEDAQVRNVVSKLDALLSRTRQNSGGATGKGPDRNAPTRPAPSRPSTPQPTGAEQDQDPSARRRADAKADEDFFA